MVKGRHVLLERGTDIRIIQALRRARLTCFRCVLPGGVDVAGGHRRHRLSEQGRDLRHDVESIGRETTITIAADPKHLGARIGVTAVLQTWGSAMTHHPDVHMVVPGGGLSLDATKWISCRPDFFLPVRVLSRLFRRLFLTMLAAAHQAGRLQFFGDHARLTDNNTFAEFLASLRKAERVVYAKQPFAGPEQVLRYLSRYTHRVAISNPLSRAGSGNKP